MAHDCYYFSRSIYTWSSDQIWQMSSNSVWITNLSIYFDNSELFLHGINNIIFRPICKFCVEQPVPVRHAWHLIEHRNQGRPECAWRYGVYKQSNQNWLQGHCHPLLLPNYSGAVMEWTERYTKLAKPGVEQEISYTAVKVTTCSAMLLFKCPPSTRVYGGSFACLLALLGKMYTIQNIQQEKQQKNKTNKNTVQ